MKNFRLFVFFILFTTIILQTSCTRNQYIQRQEDRIVGDWFFDRVRQTSLFNPNITNRYNDASISFFEDYTVIYIQDDGTVLEGSWSFNLVNGVSEDNPDQLVICLKDVDGEDMFMFWDNFSVTRRVMRAQEDVGRNDVITYRLERD